MGYVHHDPTCEVIDSQGRGTGETYDVEDDPLSDVDKCAERLENMLNLKDGNGGSTAGRWVLEMKPTSKNKKALPEALYNLLDDRGQRTTEIVSSLNKQMLRNLRDEAAAQSINMNLMWVLGYATRPSQSKIDTAVKEEFDYLAARMAQWENKTALIGEAKKAGIYPAGWHWEDFRGFTDYSPEKNNELAAEYDLDLFLTDNIADLDSYPGWD